MKFYRFQDEVKDNIYMAVLQINEEGGWHTVKPYEINKETLITLGKDEKWEYMVSGEKDIEILAISPAKDANRPKKSWKERFWSMFDLGENE